MLKIHKKLRIPLLLIPISLSGTFLYQYLTFIPKYSNAETISTPIYNGPATSPDTRTLIDITYMQEMTPGICDRSTISERINDTDATNQKQLIDRRDGKTYWVAKLIDGRCWMTQNLDLDLWDEEKDVPVILTTNNTDYKGSDADWESETGPSVIWETLGKNDIKYYSPDNTTNLSHTATGNYYSFNAATAGKGATITSNGTNIDGSICPAGWKLPTGNNSAPGSFGGLKLTSSSVQIAPYYFVASGVVLTGGVLYTTAGHYWTATSMNDYNAYDLYFDKSTVVASDKNTRYIGMSVRCVNNPDTEDVDIKNDPIIDNPDVSVTVPNIITLTIDSKSVDVDTSTSNPAEGNFTATVTTNNQYNIALSTTEGSSINLVNTTNPSYYIPALSEQNNITTNSSTWWGIKCTNSSDSTNCTKTSYTGLALTPETYFTSTTGTPTTGTSTPFTIGIQISPDLPSGTYSSSITVTASSPN